MAAIIDDATGLVDTSDVVLHSFVSEGGGGGGDSDGDGSKDGSGELDRPYYDSLNGGGSGGSCGGGASQSAAVPQIQNLSLIEGNSPGATQQQDPQPQPSPPATTNRLLSFGSLGSLGRLADQSDAGDGASVSSRSTTRSQRSTTTILTRRVVKKLGNGDLFSGLSDAVTGEPVEGRLTDGKSGEIYEGPFVRGRRHGEGGHSTRLDGSKFFGSFRNGDPYEGTLITGELTYQGRMLIPQPSSKAYIFHGPKGTLLHRNGDIYQGGFSHGRYHGRGRERSASGLNYTGHFRSGKWHGMGDLIVERRSAQPQAQSPAKALSDAERRGVTPVSKTSKMAEAGASTSSSLPFNPEAFRYTYYGEWQHGEREGSGFEKIIFGSKRSLSGGAGPVTPSTSGNENRLKRRTATYEGEFHRDRRNGVGVLSLPDGTELRGLWKGGQPSVDPDDLDVRPESSLGGGGGSDDEEHPSRSARRSSRRSRSKIFNPEAGKWEIDYANGDRYRGQVSLALAEGLSGNAKTDAMKAHLHILTSATAPVLPDGIGSMVFVASGDVYVGSFRMGKRHGFGHCMSQSNGEEFEGSWIDDLPGEVGGHRLHLFQPLFDNPLSKAGKRMSIGAETDDEETEGQDGQSTAMPDEMDSIIDEKADQVDHEQPTLSDRVALLFGKQRPPPHASLGNSESFEDKNKPPRKSPESTASKPSDDKSFCASVCSEKTQPMANVTVKGASVKTPRKNVKDNLVYRNEAEDAGPKSPSRSSSLTNSADRTLSTDSMTGSMTSSLSVDDFSRDDGVKGQELLEEI